MSEELRPPPEDFLEMARHHEAKPSGKLRIYLGMCPGVGKTYTMLQDAHRLHGEGIVVLAGVVETHGRAETQALLAGLPVLPGHVVEYRGTHLQEFHLDEALRRKPGLLLVDELAHDNAPGSRHPKRWQDVEELLGAGIDVWTTLNIQHVESLRDSVAAITGIRVRETVPDTFLGHASELRLIDLTPGQLLDRLKAGNVYLGERAAAAGENFFRAGNLKALREMALRYAAQKVEEERRAYMRHHRIAGPWRSGERFLVAVGSSPHSERLIRITCRLARAHKAGWIAAHIHALHPSDAEASGRLARNLALARSLGAEVVSLPNDDTVTSLLRLARRENVTQIVAGKSLEDTWWGRLRGISIADRLHRESGDIDILLVHPGDASTATKVRRGRPANLGPGTLREVLGGAGILTAITLVGLVLEQWIGHQSVSLLYLSGVALLGLLVSRRVVIGMALAAGLAWNFVFTVPRYSFNMTDQGDVMLLLTLLAVAACLGTLTARLKQRETASRQSDDRSQALYRLSRVISASGSLREGVKVALAQVETSFSCRASLLGLTSGERLQLLGGHPLSPKEESVCFWTLDRGQAAGRFTNTLPESSILAVPLLLNGKSEAVLVVWPGDNQLASPVQRDFLDTFAAHFQILLEREEHQRAQHEASLLERSEKFQRTLLDHVSHELKTPVAVIQGATRHLLKNDADKGALRKELLEEICKAAERLTRVFTQLVTLSKAEAGMIKPCYEVCDARDLLEEVASRDRQVSFQLSRGDFTFRTDPALLHTVLSNLVQNAIQHGGGDVELAAVQESDRVRFTVSNTGPPIPAEERNRVFERFHRGSGSGTGGMGLGLPIARQFAALLGGQLVLASSDAEKTVFSIEFPDKIGNP